MVDTVYRNLRQPDGSPVDLGIAGGRILAIEPAGRAAPAQAKIVEGNGQLLLPALVESHAHLDKTLWGLPWRPHSAGASLKDLIANERRVLREVKVPTAKRAGGCSRTALPAALCIFARISISIPRSASAMSKPC
jgi:cytosine deaminase